MNILAKVTIGAGCRGAENIPVEPDLGSTSGGTSHDDHT